VVVELVAEIRRPSSSSRSVTRPRAILVPNPPKVADAASSAAIAETIAPNQRQDYTHLGATTKCNGFPSSGG